MLQNREREQWGSKIGFILAAAGSAIGLGNIWRFPTTAGENGGGLFVLIYVFCVLVLCVPIMLAELTIGRASRSNAVGAFRKLAPGTPWFMVGGMGVLAGFLILSFYAVVGGWIIGYMVDSARGLITSLTSTQALDAHFNTMAQDPAFSIGYLLLFMALTIYIVFSGVGEGIERWSKILMPVLLVLLVLVIARSLTLPNAARGLEFLFVPRLQDLKPGTIAAALGQAFFSLSLGMGTMITYGSYIKREQNLPLSTFQVAGLDTLIAILAGMAIFPAFFAVNQNLSFAEAPGGEGLIFVAFPQVFMEMFGGNALLAQAFGSIFFLLVLIAALTSSISLLEVVTAYFVDEKGWGRKKTAVIMGAIIFLIAIPSALSNVNPGATFSVFGISFFGIISTISNDYMLPIGGLLIAVFVAWCWGKRRAMEEIADGCKCFRLGDHWHFILRWISPLVILQIILLRILNDLAVDQGFMNTLQWAFTVFDALLVSIVVVAGIFMWRRPNRKAGAPSLEK